MIERLKIWMFLKGIDWALKEAQKQDIMIKYVVPALKKQGLLDAKTNLIALFTDWIDELHQG